MDAFVQISLGELEVFWENLKSPRLMRCSESVSAVDSYCQLCFASFQEYRSEKSLEELGKLVPPECHW